MKILLFPLMLLLLASCKDEVSGWEDLNNAEQTYIRNRSRDKCLTDEASTYDKFERASDDQFNELERGDTWQIDHHKKADSSDTVYETSYLHVWKVTASAVYLLWNDNSVNPAEQRFIKITDTNNNQMIFDLRWKQCAQKELYNITASASQISITTPVEPGKTNQTSNGYEEHTYTYKISSSRLAFMDMFTESLKKEFYDEDNKLTKTETYYTTLKLLADADAPELEADFDDYANEEFCVVKSTDPVAPNTFDVFGFPHHWDDADHLVCTDNVAGPDGDGDTVSDFSAAEL